MMEVKTVLQHEVELADESQVEGCCDPECGPDTCGGTSAPVSMNVEVKARVLLNPDGTSVLLNPDGTWVLLNPDGTFIEAEEEERQVMQVASGGCRDPACGPDTC